MLDIHTPTQLPTVSQGDPQTEPLITVVTVVRNGAATLAATLESVATQTLPGIEYLVIDGQSTDGTLEIVHQHRATVTVLVSEPDKGIYDAMNKGLRLARGRWLLFLGADDTLTHADILARVAPHLKDPRSVYYGDVLLKSSGQRYCGQMSTYRLMQQNICHQAIFYPRAEYQTVQYDVAKGMLADHLYNIELWGKRVPFVYIDEAISRFNDAGSSSAKDAQKDAQFEKIKLEAIRKSFGLPLYFTKQLRTLFVKLLKRCNVAT